MIETVKTGFVSPEKIASKGLSETYILIKSGLYDKNRTYTLDVCTPHQFLKKVNSKARLAICFFFHVIIVCHFIMNQ